MTATSFAKARIVTRKSLRNGSRPGFVRHCGFGLAMAAACLAAPGLASAQDAGLRLGDGIVTRFSGFSDAEQRRLDPDGPVAQLMKIEPADAGGADPDPLETITASDVGQVFAVEIGGGGAPAAYLAASSAYGLYRTDEGEWAEGMWGPDGGPGTIWRLGPDGQPQVFATIGNGDRGNEAPGLGDLAYDRFHDRLLVSDLASGMIHSLDPASGDVLQTYDHGVDGRSYFLDARTGEYLVFDVTPVDARNRPRFDACRDVTGATADFSSEPGCWGFTDFRRRVFGLGVAEDPDGGDVRLYYAVWGGAALGSDGWSRDGEDAGSSIWSVRLDQRGAFDLTDVRREAVLPAMEDGTGEMPPVVDIAFPDASTMVLAERGRPETNPESETAQLVDPSRSRVVVLKRDGESGWSFEGRLPAGAPGRHANSAGGVALGGTVADAGDGEPTGRLWLTVDPLCGEDASCRGIDGGDGSIAGLQAMPLPVGTGLLADEGEDPAVAGLMVLARDLPAGGLGQVAINQGPSVTLPAIALSPLVGERRPVEVAAPEPAAEEAPEPEQPATAEIPEVTPQAEPEPQTGEGPRVVGPTAPLQDEAEPEAPDETEADTAEADEDEPEDAEAEEPEVAAEPTTSPADLSVSIAAGEACGPGGVCTFEVTVTNASSERFEGPVMVTDTVDAPGVSLESASGDAWTCIQGGDGVFCRHADDGLAPQAQASFQVGLRTADWYGQGSVGTCAAVTWLAAEDRARTRAVQAGLREAGFEPGAVDGAMGPNTSAAITRAERAHELPETGRISNELIVSLFGPAALLDGDAEGDNDRACGSATVNQPERPPEPAPSAQRQEPAAPRHDREISAFHRDYESRYHDPETSTPREFHDTELSVFHGTYSSGLHDARSSGLAVEERPRGDGFHDGRNSRFRSRDYDDRVRVHERGTSRTRSLHEVNMSRFHESYTSEAHDERTSGPVPVHRRALSRFHSQAPSAVHDQRTTRGRIPDRDTGVIRRRSPPVIHEGWSSRYRPAYSGRRSGSGSPEDAPSAFEAGTAAGSLPGPRADHAAHASARASRSALPIVIQTPGRTFIKPIAAKAARSGARSGRQSQPITAIATPVRPSSTFAMPQAVSAAGPMSRMPGWTITANGMTKPGSDRPKACHPVLEAELPVIAAAA